MNGNTGGSDGRGAQSENRNANVDVDVSVEADGDVGVAVDVDISVFPRDDIDSNYFLTRHAGQRLREDDRMLNRDIIRNAIRQGQAGQGKGESAKFELEVGPTTYTVLVGTDEESRGYPIITAYPDFDEPSLSEIPKKHL